MCYDDVMDDLQVDVMDKLATTKCCTVMHTGRHEDSLLQHIDCDTLFMLFFSCRHSI